ncbi:MAG TPA: tripartite tricarboxylate transporter substrate-binding protein [Ramlibacter sp.]|uniref:tripartite tricarboxylate transporter substrate-binding protein n=1 Tax=Ramlibacter sp. TaxID=1917967 RepID=UPI002BE0A3DE|nr:tripartite tricarboxylate transporter substrate-binding protein [Ramlibacter sp.]HVZ46550.1 tripartite tricarboxylate transporter substrate-binding protein [Ramlibacter sp.]
MAQPSRRHLIKSAVLAAAAVCVPPLGRAQENITRLVVTFPPGGIGDIVTRLMAQQLAKSMGQPFVVENRAGASGRVGTQFVHRAAPDGTTLLLGNTVTMVTGPLVWKTTGYDPINDFIPISQALEFELAYAAAPNVPVKDLREYAAWAARDPRNAVFGSPSIGGLGHFLGLQVGREIKVELTHVGYKGSAPLTNDLMAGQIPAGIDTLDAQVRARNAKLLATTGRKRSAFLPNVPTFTELGYPEVQGTGWFGFFAPARTPKPLIDRLSREFAAAARTPEVTQRLRAISYEPIGSTSEEFAQTLRADREKFSPLIKASGLVLDE